MEKHHRTFDIVQNTNGGIGMITEVSYTQEIYKYSVMWFTGRAKNAWWDTNELTVIGNAMETIAVSMCNPLGNSARVVSKTLFNSKQEENICPSSI